MLVKTIIKTFTDSASVPAAENCITNWREQKKERCPGSVITQAMVPSRNRLIEIMNATVGTNRDL